MIIMSFSEGCSAYFMATMFVWPPDKDEARIRCNYAIHSSLVNCTIIAYFLKYNEFPVVKHDL